MTMGKGRLEKFERLRDLCKRIVDDPHSIDGDTGAALKRATLKFAATQYVDTEQALANLYYDEELGPLLRKAVEVCECDDGGDADAEPARREKFEKIFTAKAADDDGEPLAKASRDDTGHHNLAARVVEHMTDRLDHLRQKHGFEKAHTTKESAMDNQELVSILKQDGGLGAVCKRVISDGTGISENEFVSAVTDHARERFADLPADVAFAKLYEADVMLRKALRVVRDGAWGYASGG